MNHVNLLAPGLWDCSFENIILELLCRTIAWEIAVKLLETVEKYTFAYMD